MSTLSPYALLIIVQLVSTSVHVVSLVWKIRNLACDWGTRAAMDVTGTLHTSQSASARGHRVHHPVWHSRHVPVCLARHRSHLISISCSKCSLSELLYRLGTAARRRAVSPYQTQLRGPYFIIMIAEVPVRSCGPIYSSKMSRYE